MAAGVCGWIGCKNPSEAALDARPLCRKHFYDIAARRLADYHERFAGADPVGRDRVAASAFLSELIGQAGTLVTGAKQLTDKDRDNFLALSTDAVEMYKRVQRNPRIPLRVPIRVYRAAGQKGKFELTSTVNVSKVELASRCASRSQWAQGSGCKKPKTPRPPVGASVGRKNRRRRSF